MTSSSAETAKSQPIALEENTVLAIDCTQMDVYERTLVTSLQGIVNRSGAKIYLLTGATSWINDFTKGISNGKGFSQETLAQYNNTNAYFSVEFANRYGLDFKQATLDEAIETYRDKIAGLIEYDAAVQIGSEVVEAPARTNAALTAAGLYDSLPATPALMRKYPALRNFETLINMKGKFTNVYQATKWAVDTLLPNCSTEMAASYYNEGENGTFQADFAIMNKGFCYQLNHVTKDNMEHVEAELTKDYNPVDESLLNAIYDHLNDLGYIWGWGTGGENALASQTAVKGLSLICANAGNGSFYAKLKPQQTEFKQHRADTASLQVENKFYFAFMTNEGDTYKAFSTLQNMGSWLQEARGEFPINWGVDPLVIKLFPCLADYYYSTATQNDTFFNAPAGYGYIHPAYLKADAREPFADAVKAYSKLADTHVADMWWFSMQDENGNDVKWDWVKRMGLNGMTLWDSGNRTTYEPGFPVVRSSLYYTNEKAAGVTLEQKAENVANALIKARSKQPQNAPYCTVVYGGDPYYFKLLYDRLPKEQFEAVSLEELMAIAEKSKNQIQNITAEYDFTSNSAGAWDPTTQK